MVLEEVGFAAADVPHIRQEEKECGTFSQTFVSRSKSGQKPQHVSAHPSLVCGKRVRGERAERRKERDQATGKRGSGCCGAAGGGKESTAR